MAGCDPSNVLRVKGALVCNSQNKSNPFMFFIYGCLKPVTLGTYQIDWRVAVNLLSKRSFSFRTCLREHERISMEFV
jgi:hypothetical protein